MVRIISQHLQSYLEIIELQKQRASPSPILKKKSALRAIYKQGNKSVMFRDRKIRGTPISDVFIVPRIIYPDDLHEKKMFKGKCKCIIF